MRNSHGQMRRRWRCASAASSRSTRSRSASGCPRCKSHGSSATPPRRWQSRRPGCSKRSKARVPNIAQTSMAITSRHPASEPRRGVAKARQPPRAVRGPTTSVTSADSRNAWRPRRKSLHLPAPSKAKGPTGRSLPDPVHAHRSRTGPARPSIHLRNDDERKPLLFADQTQPR